MTPENAARLRRAMEAQIRDRVKADVMVNWAWMYELMQQNRRLKRELADMREQRDTAIAFAEGMSRDD